MDATEFRIEGGTLTGYTGPGGAVVIPDGVTKIGARAFRYCAGVTHITLPNTVTEIGDEAFRNCSGLKELHLPEGKTRIGRQAFRGCKRLADENGFVIVADTLFGYVGDDPDLVIPAGVKKIDSCVFLDYPYANTIRLPEGLTTIEDDLFLPCEDLAEVYIPDSVVHFGKQAFRFCKCLADADGFVIVRNRLWGYCGKGGAVTIPEGVTGIEEGAFYGCKQMTSLVIADSVTYIEEGAFRGCQELVSLGLGSGVTTIGKQAFSLCSKLTAVHIPKNVESVGEEAFAQCENLKILTVSQGVADLGDFAFSGCKALTSVEIPGSVTRMGVGVFSGCAAMTYLALPAHIRWADHALINSLYNLQELVIPGVTPERLMSKAARNAAAVGFLMNGHLYEDPATVESYRAFVRRNKKTILPALFKLDAADGLAALLALFKTPPKEFDRDYIQPAQNASASNCMALLMDWSNQNIEQADELDSFMDELMKDPFDPDVLRESWSFKKLQDGTMRISAYKGAAAEVDFPQRVGKKKVTTIGKNVLASTQLIDGEVQSVTLPEGVTTIEAYAFFDLPHLKSVTLPKSVKTIGKYAFSGCPGLQDANGFVIFGDTLFEYFGTDPEPVVPEGVRVIEADAFRGRMHLKTVTLPESLREIREAAFFKCTALERITVPGGVRQIGAEACCECEKLKVVTLSEGVQVLADSVFSGCEALTTVNLPASITGVGLWAFEDCNIMTIHAPIGSFAEQYAEKNGVPFVAE